MAADVVTDALNMAAFSRPHQFLRRVAAYSDAGSKCISDAYTDRLGKTGARPSIGDSYGAALAESVNEFH